jgi:hypothetical protein
VDFFFTTEDTEITEGRMSREFWNGRGSE